MASWRRTLLTLHRDIGYVAIGLTFVFAISGIAVNHRHHWDYNFSKQQRTERVGQPHELLRRIEGLKAADDSGVIARAHQRELVTALTPRVGRTKLPRKAFWRGPDRLSLFFGDSDEEVIDYRPSMGVVEYDSRRSRFLIRQLNFLHLNEGRSFWTYLSDAYALALIFMAVSGALIVRGRKGLKGRGGWLTALGVALPIAAYLLIELVAGF